MLSGTGQSGTRDPGPGTHRVPENIAIQSGTRDLGPRVPESIVVPQNALVVSFDQYQSLFTTVEQALGLSVFLVYQICATDHNFQSLF